MHPLRLPVPYSRQRCDVTRTHGIGFGLLLLGGMVLAACGGDDYASTTTNSATAAQASPAQPAAASAVQVKDASGLGKVLSASDGMTLYTFNNDTAGKSNCSGSCASTWPPLIVTALPTKPDGVSGDFSLVSRDDGQKQAAFNGKPLYRYAADKKPADATGEGVGGVWFAAKVNAAAGSAAPTSKPGDYSY
jgi:predicted lipoprotein with Yx(FWY)xxD motif